MVRDDIFYVGCPRGGLSHLKLGEDLNFLVTDMEYHGTKGKDR